MNLCQCMSFEYFIHSLTTNIWNSRNLTHEYNTIDYKASAYRHILYTSLFGFKKERTAMHVNLVYEKKQEVL